MFEIFILYAIVLKGSSGNPDQVMRIAAGLFFVFIFLVYVYCLALIFSSRNRDPGPFPY